MTRNICAIIVTYRIGRALLKCFESVAKQVDKVVVVDNGCDDETVSVLKNLQRAQPEVKVFYNKENLGIAAALNMAVRYAISAGYNFILTLDHDSEATPQMVEKLWPMASKGVMPASQ